jgi:hypothetical protein
MLVQQQHDIVDRLLAVAAYFPFALSRPRATNCDGLQLTETTVAAAAMWVPFACISVGKKKEVISNTTTIQ